MASKKKTAGAQHPAFLAQQKPKGGYKTPAAKKVVKKSGRKR
jgi:hypothetical protein